jgi:Fe-S cluster biosynthesis and repair protein YggX
MVDCPRLKKKAPGLEGPPMPGRLGREVFERVSQEAWDEWSELQIKIVNEYRLDLSEAESRAVLTRQLRAFFNLDGQDEGESVLEVGTPPEEK